MFGHDCSVPVDPKHPKSIQKLKTNDKLHMWVSITFTFDMTMSPKKPKFPGDPRDILRWYQNPSHGSNKNKQRG